MRYTGIRAGRAARAMVGVGVGGDFPGGPVGGTGLTPGWGTKIDPIDFGAGEWVILFVCFYIFFPILSHSLPTCFAFLKISSTLFFSNECFISVIVVLNPSNSFLFSECSFLWPLTKA